jgi:hypothetical protein
MTVRPDGQDREAGRFQIDLVSEPTTRAQPSGAAGQPRAAAAASADGNRDNQPHARPFVGVQFDCCGTYSRIYRNAAETAYVGNCPRCARKIELKIGPGGSSSRFYTVG